MVWVSIRRFVNWSIIIFIWFRSYLPLVWKGKKSGIGIGHGGKLNGCVDSGSIDGNPLIKARRDKAHSRTTWIIWAESNKLTKESKENKCSFSYN